MTDETSTTDDPDDKTYPIVGRHSRYRVLGPEFADVKIKNWEDVAELLTLTINQVRKGILDPKTATSIGYLATVILRAASQGDWQVRRVDAASGEDESVIDLSKLDDKDLIQYNAMRMKLTKNKSDKEDAPETIPEIASA
jgi:hypothetical protein